MEWILSLPTLCERWDRASEVTAPSTVCTVEIFPSSAGKQSNWLCWTVGRTQRRRVRGYTHNTQAQLCASQTPAGTPIFPQIRQISTWIFFPFGGLIRCFLRTIGGKCLILWILEEWRQLSSFRTSPALIAEDKARGEERTAFQQCKQINYPIRICKIKNLASLQRRYQAMFAAEMRCLLRFMSVDVAARSGCTRSLWVAVIGPDTDWGWLMFVREEMFWGGDQYELLAKGETPVVASAHITMKTNGTMQA